MGRFSSLPNLFAIFWYINYVFDSKYMAFDTNIITSKSLRFKRKIKGFEKQAA